MQARPDLLRYISTESGGEFLQPGQSDLSATFQQHLARSRTERVQRLTAWDRWWVLGFVLFAWGSAWGLRRHAGLI